MELPEETTKCLSVRCVTSVRVKLNYRQADRRGLRRGRRLEQSSAEHIPTLDSGSAVVSNRFSTNNG